jgi:protein tyrosine phosphatase
MNQRHLNHLPKEYKDYCNASRPHQGLGQKARIAVSQAPPASTDAAMFWEAFCTITIATLLEFPLG